MERNTIMFVVSLVILATLTVLSIYDYYLWISGRTTFSQYSRNLVIARKCQPHFWVLLGVCVGLVVGTVIGFVLGHLFW